MPAQRLTSALSRLAPLQKEQDQRDRDFHAGPRLPDREPPEEARQGEERRTSEFWEEDFPELKG
jgi:hypothetical protein